jgi:hypothetical protein
VSRLRTPPRVAHASSLTDSERQSVRTTPRRFRIGTNSTPRSWPSRVRLRSISGRRDRDREAAESPWHRSSRGTDPARPGGLSVARDASSSRALSLLFDHFGSRVAFGPEHPSSRQRRAGDRAAQTGLNSRTPALDTTRGAACRLIRPGCRSPAATTNSGVLQAPPACETPLFARRRRLTQRANSIGVDARVTPLDPPGNPKAAAPRQRVSAQPAIQRLRRSDSTSSSRSRGGRLGEATVSPGSAETLAPA